MKSPNKIFIKRRTFWAIILPVSVVTAVLLAVFLLKGGGSSRLEDYKRTLEQSGETLDIAKLAPTVSKEGNSADNFLAAIKELSDAGNDIPRLTPGLSADKYGLAPLLASAPTPPVYKGEPQITWEQAQEKYAALNPLLQKVREIAKSPVIEIQLDYNAGFEMPILGLGDGLKASQLLAGDGLLKLREKNANAVIDDIDAILAISRVFQKQPLIISQLAVQSEVGIAQRLTWSLLQEHIAGEQELVRLQKLWDGVDLLPPLEATLRLERACGVMTFQYPPEKLEALMKKVLEQEAAASGNKDTQPTLLWRLLHRNEDEFNFLSTYQRLIDSAKSARESKVWKPFHDELDATIDQPPSLLISASNFETVSKSLSRILQGQAMADLTVAAIALERYATTEIGHPSTLAELVPEYLVAVPNDPLDGQPVRYKTSTFGGYLLYSVGLNGEDNQGVAAPNAEEGRKMDIVWPRPAPTEELAQ